MTDLTNTIQTGDCFDVLEELPAESVHAVVTDPPYGLAFMGRDWDQFEPKEYQEWCEDWAGAAKRVLKPGGHLLAFSGNRTHHRLFSGVEDAGCEIRDTLTWHYGCLSEDAEILTPDGWRSHDEIQQGDDVVAFDPDAEEFNAESAEQVFRYDHDGEMVRFTSPHTDQLVTPNHRVLHRKSGGWKTSYAGEFYGYTELPVIHGERENTAERTRRNGTDSLCQVRGDGLVSAGPGGGTQLLFSGVLSELPRRGRGYVRPPAQNSRQGPRGVDRGDGQAGARENERREQSGVERRRHREEAEGELQAGDTGPMSGRVRGDGAGERVCPRASLEAGEGTGAATHVRGGGSPQGPRQPQQRLGESGTLAEQQTAQVGRRQPRGVSVGTTLARTTRVDYSGTVWCVQVPSSYFVARRNGQVFITGNSGFPKASDISKTIDKRNKKLEKLRNKLGERLREEREAAGLNVKDVAEHFPSKNGNLTGCVSNWELGHNVPQPEQWNTLQEVIGFGDELNDLWHATVDELNEPGEAFRNRKVVARSDQEAMTGDVYGDDTDMTGGFEITEPATDAAKRWDGWKTTLKPATEFVVLARKPLSEGTVAENVQEWGTGALNIDGCRVEHEAGGWTRKGPKDDITGGSYGEQGNNETYMPQGGITSGAETGRYPSNVVFDEQAAERLDREVGELAGSAHTPAGHERNIYSNGDSPNAPDERQQLDSGGPSRYFYTSKATKSERTLDGRIENAHPTVKPQDLMEWLVKLATAEGQIVLDPFAGSGTTCAAAKDLGRGFLGIEKQAKWADVARVRVGLTPEDPARVRSDDAQEGLEAFTDGGGSDG